jgi:hypothetical protein
MKGYPTEESVSRLTSHMLDVFDGTALVAEWFAEREEDDEPEGPPSD